MNKQIEILNRVLQHVIADSAAIELSSTLIRTDKLYTSKYDLNCHICFYEAEKGLGGMAILNIGRDDLIRVCKKMLGLDISSESEIEAFGAELLNTIVGGATARFQDIGYTMRVSLPNILHTDHAIELATFKRDIFYYYEFAGKGFKFNWVLCCYDIINFA